MFKFLARQQLGKMMDKLRGRMASDFAYSINAGLLAVSKKYNIPLEELQQTFQKDWGEELDKRAQAPLELD